MLLCLTTYCLIGFNSCQKESLPQTNFDTETLDLTDPLMREDGIHADIEVEYPDEECDCCVTIQDIQVVFDPPSEWSLQFQMTDGNTCPNESNPNIGCPAASLVLGSVECLDPDNLGCDTDSINFGTCYPFNCSLSSLEEVEFFASLIPYEFGTCNPNGANLQMDESYIVVTIECTAAPLSTRCGDIDVGGNSTPPPTYTTTLTIPFVPTSDGAGITVEEIPLGECCQFEGHTSIGDN